MDKTEAIGLLIQTADHINEFLACLLGLYRRVNITWIYSERDIIPRVCDVYNRTAERRGAKRKRFCPAEKNISIHNLYHYILRGKVT